MMKRSILSALLLFVGLGWAAAQTKITGKVTNVDSGEPVPFVTVSVKGTSTAVATNSEGVYTIDAPANAATLVFTFVGYDTKEEPINGRTTINATLRFSSEALDEVIVVAYGTAKKASFTGSATTVGGTKIAREQASNVTKSLEGKVAGVQTFSTSGQPGSSASINIRGIGSISASQAPLIVVDGVPYEGSLNQINNQDIENMSILKDAAASSLYGARGSNGVVLITTKKGKSGKVQLSFENRTGFNSRGVPQYDVLDSPKEYYEMFWESLRNRRMYTQNLSAADAGIYASEQLVTVLGNYNNYDVPDDQLVDPFTGKLNPSAKLLYHDNWLDEAFKNGLRQENSISFRGGTEKTKYYASINYLYDNSYTTNSSFQRISGRVNVDQEVNSWFKMGMNAAVATTTTNSPNVGGTTFSSIFFAGQVIAPIYPVYRRDAAGNKMYNPYTGDVLYDYGTTEGHTRPIVGNNNAIAQQERNIRKYTSDVISAKAYATISFLKDFKFTANVSIDNFNAMNINFMTPDGGDAANIGGRSNKDARRYYVMNANQLLNWDKTFNDHHVEVLLGHETKEDNVSTLAAERLKFLIPTNPELANGAVLSDATSSSAGYALEGYFSQAKYDYKSKYYLSASYRRDASSRFKKDARWGNFWSVGGAWRATQEDFLQDKSWLNDLKVKASYGTQGNDNVLNNEPYKDQYQVVNQNGEIGLVYVFRGNPNITWEKSKSFNVGFESRWFNKLSVNAEYFIKNTDDMIYYKPLPPSMGLPSSIIENSMAMKNYGFEVELVYNIIKTNDWVWDFDFNLTHYKNELTKLPPDRPQTGWATGSYYRKLGDNAYNWYMYKWAGVNPDNGAPQYYADVTDAEGNVTGTKIVNETAQATRYSTGKSATPDFYGGFSTFVSYKGFDLSIAAAYQVGGWVQDSPYSGLMGGGTAGQNFHKDMYDRWTPNNRGASIPRLEADNLDIAGNSDRFLTKASYLSLRNVTLGYNFPKATLSKLGIDLLRVYVVADNLAFFSARQGFDPRQSLTGGTGYAYSAVRTVSLGLNINF